jgi:hypothetical protein
MVELLVTSEFKLQGTSRRRKHPTSYYQTEIDEDAVMEELQIEVMYQQLLHHLTRLKV